MPFTPAREKGLEGLKRRRYRGKREEARGVSEKRLEGLERKGLSG